MRLFPGLEGTVALSEQNAWVARVLGVTIAGPDRAKAAAALAAWQTARGAAMTALATLEAAVRKATHPEVDAAIVLLRAIRANLTEAPETLAQVNALIRYIATDDIVVTAEMPNVLGVRIALRAPLLNTLAGLRAALQPTVVGGGRA